MASGDQGVRFFGAESLTFCDVARTSPKPCERVLAFYPRIRNSFRRATDRKRFLLVAPYGATLAIPLSVVLGGSSFLVRQRSRALQASNFSGSGAGGFDFFARQESFAPWGFRF